MNQQKHLLQAIAVLTMMSLLIILVIACSEAPLQPESLDLQQQIDSLENELYLTTLVKRKWAYIAQCNAVWFDSVGIEPPCHGNPAPIEYLFELEEIEIIYEHPTQGVIQIQGATRPEDSGFIPIDGGGLTISKDRYVPVIENYLSRTI